MARIALCADGESLRHPEMLGLQGEILEAQEWLSLHSLARQTRLDLDACEGIGEIWVVSSDDMEAINLAAALKKDNPFRQVLLFSGDCTGSVKSRAGHADLDGVIDFADLPRLYAQRKAELRIDTQDDGEVDLDGEVDAAEGSNCLALSPVRAGLPGRMNKGFVLPVVSGSGGVGKSTVSVLLSLVAQKMGLNTLLLDLDLQFGDARELLSYEDAPSVDEVIASPRLQDQVKPVSGKPALLAAPARVEQAEAVLPHLDQLIEAQRSLFDLVVINTGCFWTEQHIQLLERCDKALFLIDQRPSALRSCKKALDLCTHCGVAASPFYVGVNRCSKNALFTSIDASCALHGIPAVELRDGGQEVETMMAAGCSADLLDSKSPFVESVQKALRELVPAAKDIEPQEQSPATKKTWFSFGKRKRKED